MFYILYIKFSCHLEFLDSMADAPTIVAPKIQIKPQSRPKLPLTLILTHTCTYTLKYSGSKCRGSNIRVTEFLTSVAA